MISGGIRSTTFIFSLLLVGDMNSSESCCALCEFRKRLKSDTFREHLSCHIHQYPVKTLHHVVRNNTFDIGTIFHTFCRKDNTRERNSTLKGFALRLSYSEK